jgi:hypothetical protein
VAIDRACNRRQRKLKFWLYYSSSSTKSRTTSPPRTPSPPFGPPLRRDVGLAEEEEYAAVHGHRRVDMNGDVELERASSRRDKKSALAQAQAEEALATAQGGRGCEKCRFREDFEVATQRLQDVTNAFGTGASLPPFDTNVFGIFPFTNSQRNGVPTGPQSKTADRYRFRYAFICSDIQLDSPAVVDTRYNTGTVLPPYTAQLESATNTPPRCG